MEMARERKPINLTLDPDVVQQLDAWISKQEIKSNRSSVIEAAIKRFLLSEDNHTATIRGRK